MKPTVALLLLLPIVASAQSGSNDMPLNNGGDLLAIPLGTSVGAPTGTVPPSLTGDLYWKVLAGDRVLHHQTAAGATMEINGYVEDLYDTDWSTMPSFYDRSHGAALPEPNGGLQPAFFQLGWTSETLVSLGLSGFGNPCSIAPSLCSPAGGACPPPGFVNGYQVEISLGSAPGTGIVVPADGTAASDHAVTWFIPGGMTALGPPCGLGDFTLQDRHSTDETMVGLPNGTNPYGGAQGAGSGPAQEPANGTVATHVRFRERVLNARADSGTGLGVEGLPIGGGAMNALRLSLGSGQATLGWEIRSQQDAGLPNLAAVGLKQKAGHRRC